MPKIVDTLSDDSLIKRDPNLIQYDTGVEKIDPNIMAQYYNEGLDIEKVKNGDFQTPITDLYSNESKWLNDLGRLGTGAVSSVVGGFAMLPAFIDSVETGDLSKMYENGAVKWAESLDEWGQEKFKNHYSKNVEQAYKEASIFEKMTYGEKFWGNSVLANAGFMIGAAVDEAIFTGLSGLTEGAATPLQAAGTGWLAARLARRLAEAGTEVMGSGAGLVRNAARIGEGLSTSSSEMLLQGLKGGAKNARQLLTSAGYESAVEAIQFKKEATEQQFDRKSKELGITREELENNPAYEKDLAEINSGINSVANGLWLMNLATVGSSNAIGATALFGIEKPILNALESINPLKRFMSSGVTLAAGEATANTLSKGAKAFNLLKSPLSEGMEEFAQGTYQDVGKKYLQDKYNPSGMDMLINGVPLMANQIAERLGDSSHEGWEEFASGFVSSMFGLPNVGRFVGKREDGTYGLKNDKSQAAWVGGIKQGIDENRQIQTERNQNAAMYNATKDKVLKQVLENKSVAGSITNSAVTSFPAIQAAYGRYEQAIKDGNKFAQNEATHDILAYAAIARDKINQLDNFNKDAVKEFDDHKSILGQGINDKSTDEEKTAYENVSKQYKGDTVAAKQQEIDRKKANRQQKLNDIEAGIKRAKMLNLSPALQDRMGVVLSYGNNRVSEANGLLRDLNKLTKVGTTTMSPSEVTQMLDKYKISTSKLKEYRGNLDKSNEDLTKTTELFTKETDETIKKSHADKIEQIKSTQSTHQKALDRETSRLEKELSGKLDKVDWKADNPLQQQREAIKALQGDEKVQAEQLFADTIHAINQHKKAVAEYNDIMGNPAKAEKQEERHRNEVPEITTKQPVETKVEPVVKVKEATNQEKSIQNKPRTDISKIVGVIPNSKLLDSVVNKIVKGEELNEVEQKFYNENKDLIEPNLNPKLETAQRKKQSKEAKDKQDKDRQIFVDKNLGKVVKINGVIGTISKVGEHYELENETKIYEYEIEDINTFSKVENKIKTYEVTKVSENEATVNGVNYIINLNELGNVESLTPVNKTEQQITNEALIIAVEIERNKLEFKKLDIEEDLVPRVSIEMQSMLSKIWEDNMNETIAEGLDKLYEGKELTEQERLQVSLWIQNVQERILELTTPSLSKDENETLTTAWNVANMIDSMLYKQEDTTTNNNDQINKTITDIEQVKKPVNTKKNKIRVKKPKTIVKDVVENNETQEVEKPVEKEKTVKKDVVVEDDTSKSKEDEITEIEKRRQEDLETTKNIGEDKLKEGRENTKKIVESLKQRYPTTSVQGIIIRILEKLIDFNKYSTIIDSDYLSGRNASGQATWFGMIISQETLDGILEGKEFEVHTFIHEFIHGFTTSKISDYNIEKQRLISGFKSNLTAKEKNAIEQLQRIFEKVKRDNPKSKEYGFTNLDEFIAEAFSNSSFQYTLKNTKAEGKKSNLFSEFINAIGDLLFEQLERWAKRFNKEIPQRDTITGILEDVLAWTEDLIDQNNKLAYIATNEEINAKYDAELAALNKTVETSKPTVESVAKKMYEDSAAPLSDEEFELYKDNMKEIDALRTSYEEKDITDSEEATVNYEEDKAKLESMTQIEDVEAFDFNKYKGKFIKETGQAMYDFMNNIKLAILAKLSNQYAPVWYNLDSITTIVRTDGGDFRKNNIQSANPKVTFVNDLTTDISDLDEFEVYTADYTSQGKQNPSFEGKNPRTKGIEGAVGKTIAIVKIQTEEEIKAGKPKVIVGFIDDKQFGYKINPTVETINIFTLTRKKVFPDKLKKGTVEQAVKDFDLRDGDDVVYLSEGKFRKGKFESDSQMIRDENGNANELIGILANTEEYLVNTSAIDRASTVIFSENGKLNPDFDLKWIGMGNTSREEMQKQLDVLEQIKTADRVKTKNSKLRFKEGATNLADISKLENNPDIDNITIWQRKISKEGIVWRAIEKNVNTGKWSYTSDTGKNPTSKPNSNVIEITYKNGEVSSIPINLENNNEYNNLVQGLAALDKKDDKFSVFFAINSDQYNQSADFYWSTVGNTYLIKIADAQIKDNKLEPVFARVSIEEYEELKKSLSAMKGEQAVNFFKSFINDKLKNTKYKIFNISYNLGSDSMDDELNTGKWIIPNLFTNKIVVSTEKSEVVAEDIQEDKIEDLGSIDDLEEIVLNKPSEDLSLEEIQKLYKEAGNNFTIELRDKLAAAINKLPSNREVSKWKALITSIRTQISNENRDLTHNQAMEIFKQYFPETAMSMGDVSDVIGKLTFLPQSVVLGVYDGLVRFAHAGVANSTPYFEGFRLVFNALISDKERNNILTEATIKYFAGVSKEQRNKMLSDFQKSYVPLTDKGYLYQGKELLDYYLETRLAQEFVKKAEKKENKSFIQKFFNRLLEWIGLVKRNKANELFTRILNKEFANVPYNAQSTTVKTMLETTNSFESSGQTIYFDDIMDSTDSYRIANRILHLRTQGFTFEEALDKTIEYYDELANIADAKGYTNTLNKLDQIIKDLSVIDVAGNTNDIAIRNIQALKEEVKDRLKEMTFVEVEEGEDIKTDEDTTQEDRTAATTTFGSNLKEIGGEMSASKMFKEYLSTMMYEEDEFNLGLSQDELKKFMIPVDYIGVYNKMLQLCAGKKRSEYLNKEGTGVLNIMAEISTEMKSIVNQMTASFGEGEWKENSIYNMVTSNLEKQLLLDKIVIYDKDGQVKVLNANSQNVVATQINKWASEFETNIRDNVELVRRVEDELKAIKVVLKKTKSTEEFRKEQSSKLYNLLKDFGMRVSPTYCDWCIEQATFEDLQVEQDTLTGKATVEYGLKKDNNILFDANIEHIFTEVKSRQTFNEKQKAENNAPLEHIFADKDLTDEERTLKYAGLDLTKEENKNKGKGAKDKLNNIARANGIFDTQIRQSSYKNAAGKTQYELINRTLIGDIMQVMTKENLEEFNRLKGLGENRKSDPTYKSFINTFFQYVATDVSNSKEAMEEVDDILTDLGEWMFDNNLDFHSDKFEIGFISGFQEVVNNENKGTTFSDADARGKALTLVGLWTEGWYNPIVAAGKSMQFIMKGNKKERLGETSIKATKNTLFNWFDQEVRRIARAKDLSKNIDNSKRGESFFINESFVNSLVGENIYNAFRKAVDKEDQKLIDEAKKQFFIDYENQEYKDELKEKLFQFHSKLADKFAEKIISDTEGKLPEKLAKDYEGDNTKALREMYFDDHINSQSFIQAFTGDPAMSFKNILDMYKRAGSFIGGGMSNETRRNIVSMGINSIKHYLGIDEYDIDKEFYEAKGKDYLINGDSVDSTDAQSYQTVDSAIEFYMKASGKYRGEVAKILNYINLGIEVGNKEWTYLDSQNAALQVRKMFYAGRLELIKTSVNTLTWQECSIWNKEMQEALEGKTLDEQVQILESKGITDKNVHEYRIALPHRKAYFDTLSLMTTQNVDYLYHSSASKRMQRKVNNNGREAFNNFESFEGKHETFANERKHYLNPQFWKEQVATDGVKTEIVHGTQMLQLIWSEQNGEAKVLIGRNDFKLNDLTDAYLAKMAERIEMNYQDIAEHLAIDPDYLRKSFVESLKSSGATTQTIKFFEKSNLNLPHVVEKTEYMFFSKMSKILSHKKSGSAMALASPKLYDVLRATTDITLENGVTISKGEVISTETFKKHYTSFNESNSTKSRLRHGIPVYNSSSIPKNINTREVRDVLSKKIKELFKIENSIRNNNGYQKKLDNAALEANQQGRANTEYSIKELIEDMRKNEPLYVESENERFLLQSIVNIMLATEDGVIIGKEKALAKLDELIDRYNENYKSVSHYNCEIILPANHPALAHMKDGFIPARFAEMVGIRIPTQDKHSMLSMKVVDTIPAYKGATVIVPLESILLSGEDFDIDKKFFYNFNVYKNKQGEWVRYGDYTTVEQMEEELVKLVLSENEDISKEVKELNEGKNEIQKELSKAYSTLKSLLELKKTNSYREYGSEVMLLKGLYEDIERLKEELKENEINLSMYPKDEQFKRWVSESKESIKNTYANIETVKEKMLESADEANVAEIKQALNHINTILASYTGEIQQIEQAMSMFKKDLVQREHELFAKMEARRQQNIEGKLNKIATNKYENANDLLALEIPMIHNNGNNDIAYSPAEMKTVNNSVICKVLFVDENRKLLAESLGKTLEQFDSKEFTNKQRVEAARKYVDKKGYINVYTATSPLDKLTAYYNNDVGSSNIGIWAVSNVFMQAVMRAKVGKLTTEDGKILLGKMRYNDIISSYLSSSTDNDKEQHAAILQLDSKRSSLLHDLCWRTGFHPELGLAILHDSEGMEKATVITKEQFDEVATTILDEVDKTDASMMEEIQKDFPFAGLDNFKDMNQAKLATWLMKNKDKKEAILFKQYLVQQADISSSYSFNVTQLLQLNKGFKGTLVANEALWERIKLVDEGVMIDGKLNNWGKDVIRNNEHLKKEIEHFVSIYEGETPKHFLNARLKPYLRAITKTLKYITMTKNRNKLYRDINSSLIVSMVMKTDIMKFADLGKDKSIFTGVITTLKSDLLKTNRNNPLINGLSNKAVTYKYGNFTGKTLDYVAINTWLKAVKFVDEKLQNEFERFAMRPDALALIDERLKAGVPIKDVFEGISEDEKKGTIAKLMFIQSVIKDGLQFKSGTVSKLLPTRMFDEISTTLDAIMSGDKDIREVFNESRTEIIVEQLTNFLLDETNKGMLPKPAKIQSGAYRVAYPFIEFTKEGKNALIKNDATDLAGIDVENPPFGINYEYKEEGQKVEIVLILDQMSEVLAGKKVENPTYTAYFTKGNKDISGTTFENRKATIPSKMFYKERNSIQLPYKEFFYKGVYYEVNADDVKGSMNYKKKSDIIDAYIGGAYKEKVDVEEKQKPVNQSITFEEEQTSGYRDRTIKNASADATIAIAVDFNSAGEKLTKSSVLNQNKKYIDIDANSLVVTADKVNKIVNVLNTITKQSDLFAEKSSGISLNIAGNGIYTMKGRYTQEQVDEFTYELLKQVIASPNLKVKIDSLRTGGQTGFDESGAKAGVKLGLPTLILAPKGWTFRNINGQDISNEQKFKERFVNQSVKANEQDNRSNTDIKNDILMSVGWNFDSTIGRAYHRNKNEDINSENAFYKEFKFSSLDELNMQIDSYLSNNMSEQQNPASIYDKLGNKTVSNNVVIKSVYQQEGIKYAKSIGGVFSLRVNNSNTHFGNPFSSVPAEIAKGLIPTNSTKESVEKYIDWILNDNFYTEDNNSKMYNNVQVERRDWIREQLKSGILKGKPIVYYKELNEPSHATALDYLINKYDWNENKPSISAQIKAKQSSQLNLQTLVQDFIDNASEELMETVVNSLRDKNSYNGDDYSSIYDYFANKNITTEEQFGEEINKLCKGA